MKAILIQDRYGQKLLVNMASITKVNFSYKDPNAEARYVNGILQEPSVGVAIYLGMHRVDAEESAVSIAPDFIECFGNQAQVLRDTLPKLMGVKDLASDARIPD